MIKKEWQANVLLLLAAAIWGFTFIAQRIASNYVGAFTFNAIRLAIGAVSLLPIIFIAGRKPSQGADAVPLKNTIVPGIILGLVLFTAATLQQVGIESTTAGKAGFITDLYIVLVPIAEVVFGKKLKKSIWVSVILAAIGLYLISVTEKFTVSSGDILVFIGSFFWTVHILLIDRYSKKMNPLKLSLMQYVTSAVLSFAAAFIFEKITVYGLYNAIIPILYSGIFSVGIAFTLQITGQRYSKPAHASIILSMESVFAFIAGVLILHENMNMRGYAGCLLMVSAMLLTQFGGFRRKLALEK